MKISTIVIACFIALLVGCRKQTSDGPVDYTAATDLSLYNMKIIPSYPLPSSNIKLIVMDDCQYNVLSSVTKSGNRIDIEKHFNSMMKLPCMLRNDSIQIGQLQKGTYEVFYRLMDLANQSKAQVSFAITFLLIVSE